MEKLNLGQARLLTDLRGVKQDCSASEEGLREAVTLCLIAGIPIRRIYKDGLGLSLVSQMRALLHLKSGNNKGVRRELLDNFYTKPHKGSK